MARPSRSKKKKKKKQDLRLVSYELAGGIEWLKAAQDLTGLERACRRLSLASPRGSRLVGGLKRHHTFALRTVHIAATATHKVTVELLTNSVFFHISASSNYSFVSLSDSHSHSESLLFYLILSVKCSSIKTIIQFILFALAFESLILILDNCFDLNFKMLAHWTHHSLSQINYFSEFSPSVITISFFLFFSLQSLVTFSHLNAFLFCFFFC